MNILFRRNNLTNVYKLRYSLTFASTDNEYRIRPSSYLLYTSLHTSNQVTNINSKMDSLKNLFQKDGPLRYYYCFFAFYGMILLSSVWMIPAIVAFPRNYNVLILAARFCRNASWMIGVKWTIRGEEHMRQERTCVVVANHQSSLDVLGLYHLMTDLKRCAPVVKSELFWVWPFGLAAWLAGCIFIDRGNSSKSRAKLNKTIQHLKDKKLKMWMFPEGTRRNTGDIHEFRKGAFHIAVNGQLPILPIVFSRYYFMSKPETRFEPGRVIITALPVISTEGLSAEDIPELMERTRQKMLEVFHRTNAELESTLKNEQISLMKPKL